MLYTTVDLEAKWNAKEKSSHLVLVVAALTIAVSVIAVLAVRAAAVRILHPNPTFVPLALASDYRHDILRNRGDLRVPEDFV